MLFAHPFQPWADIARGGAARPAALGHNGAHGYPVFNVRWCGVSRAQLVFSPASPDEVERAFYEAMQQGDIDQLMACWADSDHVSCVHPGGPRLLGLPAVRHAFGMALANGPVRVRLAKAHRFQHDQWAVHSVLEAIEWTGHDGPQTAWVLATNVYVRQPEGWRMVVHHASPGQREEPVELSSVPRVLH